MGVIEDILAVSSKVGEVRIMEVCGGHTNTIMKYGLRQVLPPNIKLISGPGCPVCVTSQKDVDCAVELALKGIKIATYGDMVNVPGTKMSLADARSRGADVKIVYSVNEIENDRVFFAVGFETTVPMTAKFLQAGGTVYSAHKLIPPALRWLTEKMKIDGFIDPGHVSAIIGSDIYNELDVPQVISGFKPEQVLNAILKILKMVSEHECKVVNDYPEVVAIKGNTKALDLIYEVMKPTKAEWRGIGELESSGLEPKNKRQDAKVIYSEVLKGIESKPNKHCRCGEIVRGLCEPKDCMLFGKACTPITPQGACMVSASEGACAIAFKYGKSLAEADEK